MKSSKTAVIIPTYNGSRFIVDTVEAFLNQDANNVSLYICDDCSDDGTADLLKRQYDHLDNVNIYRSDKRLGIAKIMQFAAHIIPQDIEYIAWFSHDDVPSQDKISKQIAALRQSNADFCTHSVTVSDASISYNYNSWLFGRRYFRKNTYLNLIKFGCFIPTISLMVKRDTLDRYQHPVRFSSSSDFAYLLDLCRDLNGIHLDKELATYRRHESNYTSDYTHAFSDISIVNYNYENYQVPNSVRKFALCRIYFFKLCYIIIREKVLLSKKSIMLMRKTAKYFSFGFCMYAIWLISQRVLFRLIFKRWSR
ncbi:putative glycosyltransferase [Rhodobacteraceae bacterium HIMB11]|nr:putative glycosyltransferase [Rhodobacteraceae bacterium HIMB11]